VRSNRCAPLGRWGCVEVRRCYRCLSAVVTGEPVASARAAPRSHTRSRPPRRLLRRRRPTTQRRRFPSDRRDLFEHERPSCDGRADWDGNAERRPARSRRADSERHQDEKQKLVHAREDVAWLQGPTHDPASWRFSFDLPAALRRRYCSCLTAKFHDVAPEPTGDATLMRPGGSAPRTQKLKGAARRAATELLGALRRVVPS